jgi:hypothetical protein
MSQTAFTLAEPAAQDAVMELRREFPNLPAEYFSFLLGSNGGEGFLGIGPGYAVLWGAQEVGQFSSEYEVQMYLPGYVAVGTSGGGDLFVFPLSGSPAGIFVVPAIGMAPDVVDLVAPSFSAFVATFGGNWRPHA